MNFYKNLLFIVVFLMHSFLIFAQEPEETFIEKFRKEFKKDYFSVGAVMQFVFDYQNERTMPGNNGFNVANMRLQLKGNLDFGFGYLFQTNFISSSPILDAYMYYEIFPELKILIGQLKSPFSAEFLIAAPDIDFVNRSRVVSALAPGRQIGFQLSGLVANNSFNYNISMSNGNSTKLNNNDNRDFLYTARVAFLPKLFEDNNGKGSLEFGFNAAFSKDKSANLMDGMLPAFSGDRFLIGADVRLNYNRFLLSGEYINAKLEPDTGAKTTPKGFHATAGYMILQKVQLLLRWDQFDLDKLAVQNAKSDWLVLGINFWPTSATELQLNYIVDLDESDINRHQVLVNAQIVF